MYTVNVRVHTLAGVRFGLQRQRRILSYPIQYIVNKVSTVAICCGCGCKQLQNSLCPDSLITGRILYTCKVSTAKYRHDRNTETPKTGWPPVSKRFKRSQFVTVQTHNDRRLFRTNKNTDFAPNR